jgi:hypothetical protein
MSAAPCQMPDVDPDVSLKLMERFVQANARKSLAGLSKLVSSYEDLRTELSTAASGSLSTGRPKKRMRRRGWDSGCRRSWQG